MEKDIFTISVDFTSSKYHLLNSYFTNVTLVRIEKKSWGFHSKSDL